MRLVVVYSVTIVNIAILTMVRHIIVSNKWLWQLWGWGQNVLHYQWVV
jgi:hypothetical protein